MSHSLCISRLFLKKCKQDLIIIRAMCDGLLRYNGNGLQFKELFYVVR